jgi:type IV secretory pathway VirB10-like protein
VFFIFTFAAYILVIYFSLRLSVWPPAVVATNRISPREPWQLTRGNVWRLIGAFILTFGWIYVLVLVPAVGAYWYYTNKMKAALPEVPAITAPALPETEAPKDSGLPQAPAGATPAPSVAPAPPALPAPPAAPAQPQQPAPAAAPVAPSPATPPPEAAMPEIAPDSGVEVDRDAARRQVEGMIGPFAAVMWVVFLFMYIFFTALAVALMSFSYKALKGYEAHEPIPAD